MLTEIITGKLECYVRGVLLVGRSERSVNRELADLNERGLIELRRMLAPCISDTKPIHVHLPGREPPDVEALAFFAQRRSRIAVATEVFITATKRCMDREGGCYHGPIRGVDA